MNREMNKYIERDIIHKANSYESFMHYDKHRELIVLVFIDNEDGCIDRVKLQHYIERNYNVNVWTHDGFKDGKRLVVCQNLRR